ncbi:hypothetical protein AB0L06_17570 [Spirillospora sp. NPDC052269]
MAPGPKAKPALTTGAAATRRNFYMSRSPFHLGFDIDTETLERLSIKIGTFTAPRRLINFDKRIEFDVHRSMTSLHSDRWGRFLFAASVGCHLP